MENYYHDHGCGRIGMRVGLLCAGLGVLIAAAFSIFTGLLRIFDLYAPLVFGLLALFVAAGFLGNRAGVYLCRRGNQTGTNILIGLALAFGSIVISVWAGCVFHIFFHNPNQIIEVSDIPAIFLGSLLLVLIFGGLPAAVLGVVYGLLVGMQLERSRV